jgi:hypothetical protein
MTYTYANPQNTLITNGQGTSIPVDETIPEYQKLIADDVIIGPYVAPPTPIPIITATQMLIVLQAMGFITEAEATDRTIFPTAFSALLSGTAAENAAIKIRWANLTIVERNDPLVSAFGSLLSLTSEQIDGMFIQASQV